jgi:hypothetical protein
MEMGTSAMNAQAEKELAPTPMESSAPLCNCISSDEVSAPAMNQEAQRIAAPVASSLDLVSLQADLAQFASESYRTPPIRAFSCSSQSVLCTFQI